MISNPDFEKVDGLVEWLRAVPYEVLRHGRLYNAEELYQGYEPSVDVVKDRVSFADCYDSRVYQHFIKQGKIAIATFGPSTAKAAKDAGLRLDIEAPSEKYPSMTGALQHYLVMQDD